MSIIIVVVGLRTLCIAMTELEPEEYTEWNKIYYEASTALDNRTEKVDEAAELIERVCDCALF